MDVDGGGTLRIPRPASVDAKGTKRGAPSAASSVQTKAAPSAMAQLHSAQCAVKKIKVERDTFRRERNDAVEDRHDESQYSALFIDQLQSKIDRLKKLCPGAGVAEAAVRGALEQS